MQDSGCGLSPPSWLRIFSEPQAEACQPALAIGVCAPYSQALPSDRYGPLLGQLGPPGPTPTGCSPGHWCAHRAGAAGRTTPPRLASAPWPGAKTLLPRPRISRTWQPGRVPCRVPSLLAAGQRPAQNQLPPPCRRLTGPRPSAPCPNSACGGHREGSGRTRGRNAEHSGPWAEPSPRSGPGLAERRALASPRFRWAGLLPRDPLGANCGGSIWHTLIGSGRPGGRGRAPRGRGPRSAGGALAPGLLVVALTSSGTGPGSCPEALP